MADTISNSLDVIDVRDVIARYESLETDTPQEDVEEFNLLSTLLDDLKGNGGDEDWRGSWYPITLVRDSYFEDFARDEAESLDLIKYDSRWPYTCIDWEQAASELKQNYTSVEFGDVTYWIRS